MSQIIWITQRQALAIHQQQINLFGGSPGILDKGKLSSALARPKHLFTYQENANLYQLAAAYGWGIAKNHPFVDGNKRTAFVIMAVFLQVNGIELMLSDEQVVEIMLAVASSEISESELCDRLQTQKSL